MGAANSKPPSSAQRATTTDQSKVDNQFYSIKDRYESIEEVQQGLRQAGLESSQLIVGIDFTKSNEWTGQNTFGSRCLHDISLGSNPYMEALGIISKTLEAFDDDNVIPCYGFGDVSTHDQQVFSFFPDDLPANGLEGALVRYQQIAPFIQLSGPTSFAPILQQTMRTVIDSGMQYHILVIIADGQVTPNCLEDTVNAIVLASQLPISIILVGVGDGPWDDMEDFDDKLPTRKFDNFQFVNFQKIMDQAKVYENNRAKKEAHFAVHALMEVPEQYKLVQKLGLMKLANSNIQIDRSKQMVVPPPATVLRADTLAMAGSPTVPNLHA